MSQFSSLISMEIGTNEPDKKVHDKPTVVRNATDLQRLKLEKLMKHPDKAVIIPEKPKERGIPAVPEFVRNVMGSSAGAGSGEFHVYRHLRRKEYARQKFMKEKGERERLEDEYHQKLEDNKRKADEKTAKKRAKRLKRKGRKGKKIEIKQEDSASESEESDSENEEETEEITVIKEEETEKVDENEDKESETQKESSENEGKEIETQKESSENEGKEIETQKENSENKDKEIETQKESSENEGKEIENQKEESNDSEEGETAVKEAIEKLDDETVTQ